MTPNGWSTTAASLQGGGKKAKGPAYDTSDEALSTFGLKVAMRKLEMHAAAGGTLTASHLSVDHHSLMRS